MKHFISQLTKRVAPAALLSLSIATTTQGRAGVLNDTTNFMTDSTTIRAGSAALAALAPPPLNGVGVQLINGLWSTSDGTTEMLNEMNSKLDGIQGSINNIQNNLATLRSDIRRDFEQVLANRTKMDIKATIEHVVDRMKIDYNNAVKTRYYVEGQLAGLSSPFLNSTYLHQLESTLSESIDYFIFDTSLSPQHQMTTAADFILMAELHLMLIQEQIQLFKSQGYVCITGEICQPRESMLETFINNYFDRVNLYTEYMETLATTIKSYRLSKIQTFKLIEYVYYICDPRYTQYGCVEKWNKLPRRKRTGYL